MEPTPQQPPKPLQWQCWILNPPSHRRTLFLFYFTIVITGLCTASGIEQKLRNYEWILWWRTPSISIWLPTFISGRYYVPEWHMIKLTFIELTWLEIMRIVNSRTWSQDSEICILDAQKSFVVVQLSPLLPSLPPFYLLPSSLPVLLNSQVHLKSLHLSDSALRDKKVRPNSLPQGSHSLLAETTTLALQPWICWDCFRCKESIGSHKLQSLD